MLMLKLINILSSLHPQSSLVFLGLIPIRHLAYGWDMSPCLNTSYIDIHRILSQIATLNNVLNDWAVWQLSIYHVHTKYSYVYSKLTGHDQKCHHNIHGTGNWSIYLMAYIYLATHFIKLVCSPNICLLTTGWN